MGEMNCREENESQDNNKETIGFFNGPAKIFLASVQPLLQSQREVIEANLQYYLNLKCTGLTATNQLIKESIQASFQSIISLRSSLDQFTSLMKQQISELAHSMNTNLHGLFNALPDISEFIEKLKQGAMILKKFDYGFALDFFSYDKIMDFGLIPKSECEDVVSQEAYRLTCASNFADEIDRLLSNSSILDPRAEAIISALNAHKQRQFCLSVPVFILQLEGVIGDALILKKLVRLENGKLYKVVASNNKSDIKGLQGLNSLVRQSDLMEDGAFAELSELIVSRLADDRNKILHGRNPQYGTEKNSTTALLALVLFMQLIHRIECSFAGE